MRQLDILQIILLAIILAVSIGLHEYAHALISYRLGDPTPKLQKRLTPNPVNHIDPIGFIMIFLIGFGRGKPVQVNPMYYKKPVAGELMVALAGPATNIVLAIIGIFVLLIYGQISGYGLTDVLMNGQDVVLSFWKMFSFINIALAIFNMFPIPPLDGFRLIKMFFPAFARWVLQYQMYIAIVFLILILGPGRGTVGNVIFTISNSIFDIIFTVFSHIIY